MRAILLLPALLLAGPGARAQEPVFEQGWTLRLEPLLDVYDPDKEMPIRFTVENPGDGEMGLAEPVDYSEGLQITDPDGKVIKAYGKTRDIKRRVRSDGRGFIGRAVDVAKTFDIPDRRDGWYRLRWKLGDAESREIRIFVMPDYIAELETNHGTITIEFFPAAAPNHVARFVRLVREGFYDGTRFHRVIEQFMMQGGRPKDPGEDLEPLCAETSGLRHTKGTVAMARGDHPDSARTEFFICFRELPHLDGKYTIFGRVIGGEDVLDLIEKVKTDHSPCACGSELPPGPCQGHCGVHHKDEPLRPVVLKKAALKTRGREGKTED